MTVKFFAPLLHAAVTGAGGGGRWGGREWGGAERSEDGELGGTVSKACD